MSKKKRLAVAELNPHLLCILCGGYYVDATTVIECLHTFCKSCIVRYLETSNFCPTCDVLVHKTKPLLSIRPDKSLQNIVYKLVPGLFKDEMCRRKRFYSDIKGKPTSEEDGGNHMNSEYLLPSDSVSIALKSIPPVDEDHQVDSIFLHTRFFNCPAGLTIALLKRLLRAKFDLPESHPVLISASKEDILQDDLTLIDVAYIKSWKRECPLVLYYKIYFTKRLKVDPALENKNICVEKEVTPVEDYRMPKLEREVESPCSSELEERSLPKLSPMNDLASCTSFLPATPPPPIPLPPHPSPSVPPLCSPLPPCVIPPPSLEVEEIRALKLDSTSSASKTTTLTLPPTYKAIIPAPLRPPPLPEVVVSLSSIAIPSVDPLAPRNCSPGAYSYGFGLLTPPSGNVPSLFPGGVVDPTKISGTVLPFGLTLGPSLICASPAPVSNLSFSDTPTIPSLNGLTLQSVWSPAETTSSANVIFPIAGLDTSVVHSVSSEPISSVIKSDSPLAPLSNTPPHKGGKKPKLIRPKKDSVEKSSPRLRSLPPPPPLPVTTTVEEKEVQLMISESGVMIVNEGDKASNRLEGLINPVYSEANELLTKIESGSLLSSIENGSLLSLSDPYSEESDTSDGAEKLAQIKKEITSILSTLSPDDSLNREVGSQTEAGNQLVISEKPNDPIPFAMPYETGNNVPKVFPLPSPPAPVLAKDYSGRKKILMVSSTKEVFEKETPLPAENVKPTSNSSLPVKTLPKTTSDKREPKKDSTGVASGHSASSNSTSQKKIPADGSTNLEEEAKLKPRPSLPPASSLPPSMKDSHLVKRVGRKHSQPIGYKTLKNSPRGWNPTISREKLQQKLNFSSAPKTSKFFKARNSAASLPVTPVTSKDTCSNAKPNESLSTTAAKNLSPAVCESSQLSNHVSSMPYIESHGGNELVGVKCNLISKSSLNPKVCVDTSDLGLICQINKSDKAKQTLQLNDRSKNLPAPKKTHFIASHSVNKFEAASSIESPKVLSGMGAAIEIASETVNSVENKESRQTEPSKIDFPSQETSQKSKAVKEVEGQSSSLEDSPKAASSSVSSSIHVTEAHKTGGKSASLSQSAKRSMTSVVSSSSPGSVRPSPTQQSTSSSQVCRLSRGSSLKSESKITFPSPLTFQTSLSSSVAVPASTSKSASSSLESSTNIPQPPRLTSPSTAGASVNDVAPPLITSAGNSSKPMINSTSEISSQEGKAKPPSKVDKKTVSFEITDTCTPTVTTTTTVTIPCISEFASDKTQTAAAPSVVPTQTTCFNETLKLSSSKDLPKGSSHTSKDSGLCQKESLGEVSKDPQNKESSIKARPDALGSKSVRVFKAEDKNINDIKGQELKDGSRNAVQQVNSTLSIMKPVLTDANKEGATETFVPDCNSGINQTQPHSSTVPVSTENTISAVATSTNSHLQVTKSSQSCTGNEQSHVTSASGEYCSDMLCEREEVNVTPSLSLSLTPATISVSTSSLVGLKGDTTKNSKKESNHSSPSKMNEVVTFRENPPITSNTVGTTKTSSTKVVQTTSASNEEQKASSPAQTILSCSTVDKSTYTSSICSQGESLSNKRTSSANVQLHYTIANALNSAFSSSNADSDPLSFVEKNMSLSLGAIATLSSIMSLPTSDGSCAIPSTLSSTAMNFDNPLAVSSPYASGASSLSDYTSSSPNGSKENPSSRVSSSSSHSSVVPSLDTLQQKESFRDLSSLSQSSSTAKSVTAPVTGATLLSPQNHITSPTQCHTQGTVVPFSNMCNRPTPLVSNSKTVALPHCSFSSSGAQQTQVVTSGNNPKLSSDTARLSSQKFEAPHCSQLPLQNTLETSSSFSHNTFHCGENFYFGNNSIQNSSMLFGNNFIPSSSTSLTHASIPSTYTNSATMNTASIGTVHDQTQNKSKSHTSEHCVTRALPTANIPASSSSTTSVDCSQSLGIPFAPLTGGPLHDATKFIQNLLSPSSHTHQEQHKSNLKSSVEELDKILLQTISSSVSDSKIADLFPTSLPEDVSENPKVAKLDKNSFASTSLETPVKHSSHQQNADVPAAAKAVTTVSQLNTISLHAQSVREAAPKNSQPSAEEIPQLNSSSRSHVATSENTFQNVLNGSSSHFQASSNVANGLSKSATHLPSVSLQVGSTIPTSSAPSASAHYKPGYHPQTQCCKHQTESSRQVSALSSTKDHNIQGIGAQQVKMNEQHGSTPTSHAKKNNDLVDKSGLNTSTSSNVYAAYSDGSNYNTGSLSANLVDSTMAKKVSRSTGYLPSNGSNQSPHQFPSSLSLNSMMNTFHETAPSSNISGPQKHASQGTTWDTTAFNPFIFNNNTETYNAAANKGSFMPNSASNCIQQNLFRNHNNVMGGKDSNMNSHSQTNFNPVANHPCSPKNPGVLNTQYGGVENAKKGTTNVDSYDNFSVGSQKYNASLYYSNYNNNYANFFSNSQAQGSPSLTSLVSGSGYNFPLSGSKFTSCFGQNSAANNSYFSSGNFNVNCGSNYQACINQPSTSNVGSSNMSSNFGNNFSGPLCNISLPYYSNCSFSYNSYPYFYQGGDMSLLSPASSFMSPFSCLPPRSSLSSRNSSPSQSFNDFSLQSGLFPVMPFVSPLQGNGSRGTPSPVGGGIPSSFGGRPFSANYAQKANEATSKTHKAPQPSPKAANSALAMGLSSAKSKHRKNTSGSKHKPPSSRDSASKTSVQVPTDPNNHLGQHVFTPSSIIPNTDSFSRSQSHSAATTSSSAPTLAPPHETGVSAAQPNVKEDSPQGNLAGGKRVGAL